jgi:hypothetical protein
MKVEITKAQLEAIKCLTDTVSGMIGGYDEDYNKEAIHNVRLIDRFLKKNGEKRDYK